MTPQTRVLIPALLAACGLLLGCQPVALHGDFVPAQRGEIGRRQLGLTVGDGPNGAHVFFLNFDGAALKTTNTGDNAALDESQIPTQAMQFPAFDPSPYSPAYSRDAAIGVVVGHLRQFYAAYNVQIVTTRPSAGRYTMCMIGGTPDLVGIGSSAAGVAPLDCDNENEADIVYAFAEVVDPSSTGSASASLNAIAVTAAQGIAHAFGLGHTLNQADLMYPQLSSKQKSFGGSANLANDGSGQCSPGATKQDSAAMLLDVLGPTRTTSGPLPMVQFLAPVAGSNVPRDFDVLVDATETGGSIVRVEITASGQMLATLTSAPYKTSLRAPQDGAYELTATAFDAAGNLGTATVQFTAKEGAPAQNTCAAPADCQAPLSCISGMCVTPPTCAASGCPSGQVCGQDGKCAAGSGPSPGELGAACKTGGECHSGLCATLGGGGYCTQTCDDQHLTCPGGVTCLAAGAVPGVSERVCGPAATTGAPPPHGGCSIGGGQRDGRSAALLLLLGIALGAGLARRRIVR